MTNLFQVIEFEHSVEVHPLCEKDLQDSVSLSWDQAHSFAVETLSNKLEIHNEHYQNWEDPKDLAIINKLIETQSILQTKSKEEYLDIVFFA